MTNRTLIRIAAVVVAAVSLLVAGCGGGSSTTAATTTQNGPRAYARCMHSHGVPNFPDPTSSGGGDKEGVIAALREVGNSQAEAAQTACMHVNGGSPGTG